MTKIRMIRLRKRWSNESYSSESFGRNTWNTWNIGDVGYIEDVIPVYFSTQIVLIVVLANKIVSCNTDAVEVIKD